PVWRLPWPVGVIVRSKPFCYGGADRHIARNIEVDDIMSFTLRYLPLVEKCPYLGLATAFEIDRSQRRVEAHFKASGARVAPAPAAVARKNLRLSQLAAKILQVESERDAAPDHVGRGTARVQVVLPGHSSIREFPDTADQTDIQRLAIG